MKNIKYYLYNFKDWIEEYFIYFIAIIGLAIFCFSLFGFRQSMMMISRISFHSMNRLLVTAIHAG